MVAVPIVDSRHQAASRAVKALPNAAALASPTHNTTTHSQNPMPNQTLPDTQKVVFFLVYIPHTFVV